MRRLMEKNCELQRVEETTMLYHLLINYCIAGDAKITQTNVYIYE